MKPRIAVEPALTPIKDYLIDKGYQVDSINLKEEPSKQSEKYDAFIITGMNKDFMGIRDTSTKATVIDATGMTAEQVFHELEMRFD